MTCCRGQLAKILELEGYDLMANVIDELTSGSEDPVEIQSLRSDLQTMIARKLGTPDQAEVLAGMVLDLFDTEGPIDFPAARTELGLNLRHAGIQDVNLARLQDIWSSLKERAFR